MRRITRRPLSAATQGVLKSLSAKVSVAANPAKKAKALWDNKPAAAFSEIRTVLGEMASGRSRCMYCEDSLGTDIEHFYPKARYPSRAFRWTNYLLACSHCNSNLKRDQFPFKHGKPTLIDPSADDPRAHLLFIPVTGEFTAIGLKGQPSIDVFGLNETASPRKLPEARRAVFEKLQLLLIEYDRYLVAGNQARADLMKEVVRGEPFSAVLDWLVSIAQGPAATAVLRPGVSTIVAQRGIAAWL